MSEPASTLLDYASFLRLRERGEARVELVRGVVVAMAPPSKRHTLIADNLLVTARAGLAAGPCRPFGQGAEIRPPASGAGDDAFLPDLVIACGPVDLATPTVAEPVAIVEVLSPSTAERDAGYKFTRASEIASLRHYLLVEQDRRMVVHHGRGAPGEPWTTRLLAEGAVEFGDLGLTLRLEAIYADTGL
ncbi:MAG: Uma2 family endonuclease [Geminicoccaceae bacterium]|nr:MAG: Uma2 family endonuclease [Geminicoccaceae bacterium]